MARDRLRSPWTLAPPGICCTNPPAFVILAVSPLFSGLWSSESATTCPNLDSTALESPALAQNSRGPSPSLRRTTSTATAVQPWASGQGSRVSREGSTSAISSSPQSSCPVSSSSSSSPAASVSSASPDVLSPGFGGWSSSVTADPSAPAPWFSSPLPSADSSLSPPAVEAPPRNLRRTLRGTTMRGAFESGRSSASTSRRPSSSLSFSSTARKACSRARA
mmetsp:Transcript_13179/g.37420  ORF Transcript_13179/g.37420 Transcript_13179/m.37420 type:complete len:221 (-) Transcript_13179:329-991(-)